MGPGAAHRAHGPRAVPGAADTGARPLPPAGAGTGRERRCAGAVRAVRALCTPAAPCLMIRPGPRHGLRSPWRPGPRPPAPGPRPPGTATPGPPDQPAAPGPANLAAPARTLPPHPGPPPPPGRTPAASRRLRAPTPPHLTALGAHTPAALAAEPPSPRAAPAPHPASNPAAPCRSWAAPSTPPGPNPAAPHRTRAAPPPPPGPNPAAPRRTRAAPPPPPGPHLRRSPRHAPGRAVCASSRPIGIFRRDEGTGGGRAPRPGHGAPFPPGAGLACGGAHISGRTDPDFRWLLVFAALCATQTELQPHPAVSPGRAGEG